MKKKFELIRIIFDHVMEHGKSYCKADAISSDCTRDSFIHRAYIKKVENEFPIHLNGDEVTVSNIAVTCVEKDYSDATDADVRIEFIHEGKARTILYANELPTECLNEMAEKLGK